MKVVVLIDNIPDKDCRLTSEHGLSLYIESEGTRILLDTGLSGSFIDNAHSLGVNLNLLDFCFISHGHNDHCGGLARFFETIPHTPVYLSDSIVHERYFSSRHATKKSLSIDRTLFQRYSDRLIPLKESRWLTPTIAAVYCHLHDYSSPQGNLFLTKEREGLETPDDFDHEMALAFKTPMGLVVFSSCSHHGAVNIMKSCEAFTKESIISHYMGGLHFVDCNTTDVEVKNYSDLIHAEYPNTKIITGHCTCDKAKELLNTMNLDINLFHTGSELIINCPLSGSCQ